MIRKSIVAILTLFMALGAGLVATSAPEAAARPSGEPAARGCADVEVIFARGTAEPAGPVGLTGLAFTEALRSRLSGQTVALYGVNYPASDNFRDRLGFAHTVLDGVNDTQRRVKHLAKNCPDTEIVLGGYSQGAAVVGYAAHNGIDVPDGYSAYARHTPPPLPDEVAEHISAIVMFGPPSDRFIRDIGAPPIRVAAQHRANTVRYCIPGDTICDGSPVGGPNALHVLYTVNGMAFTAADYVARRV